MGKPLQIGSYIGPYDPFWIQLREVTNHTAQEMGLELVPIEIARLPETLPVDEQVSVVEELLAQKLDALICWRFPEKMITQLLDGGLPVIFLSESSIRHPLFVSPHGWYDSGKMIGDYFVKQLQSPCNVLCIGGLLEEGGQDGRSRIDGFFEAFKNKSNIQVEHMPSHWEYQQAHTQIESYLAHNKSIYDAIFGLSDPIALAAIDVIKSLEQYKALPLIAGVNGDPLALAALSEGSLKATTVWSILDIGSQAVELAYQAAQKQPLPDHFDYESKLVTAENLTEVALQKLVEIADLPTRLLGVNRQVEQSQLTQLEISTIINRRVGALLDRHQLSQEIVELIRENYSYDFVRLFLWSSKHESFILEQDHASELFTGDVSISFNDPGILGEALRRNEPIIIPDTRASYRFPPDPNWPDTLSRVVLPVHLGETILGLLDLHSLHHVPHMRQELVGLQPLADQLGIAIRNAELYEEAVTARAVAEKADQLKTRLLANVGHELRAPLNVILGYSQSALSKPNPYEIELPNGLRRDIGYIFRSCEHLTRLINDLLDLSRAEIDQLDLFPEVISTRSFLEETFFSFTDVPRDEITWKLDLPDQLPMIQVDPVRFRQIIFNLLSNAHKFTSKGEIVLGAKIQPPHLHLWVKDTGRGIPVEIQERIFEPFVTIEELGHRSEGIGLGLSITRRLVALHGGFMELESQVDIGSTFHIYFPLPNLSGKFSSPPTAIPEPVLLFISIEQQVSQTLLDMAAQMNLSIRLVPSINAINNILKESTPSMLAWDMESANPNEWEIIEHIRSHPQLCQLPFIVYQDKSEAGMETTEVIMKPVVGKTLLDAINLFRPALGSRPILIVDDESETREFYQRLINETLPGYPIISAENGAEALKAMQEITPSLVILDLMMPNVDGFMVLQKMRANPNTRQVPVLVMSGKILTVEDIKRLDYAHVSFQSKDILSQDEVAQLLSTILNPNEPLSQPTSLLVKAAIVYLHQNYMLSITRQEIAQAVGVSSNYLSRIFRQEVGISAWDCLNRFRILKARELLCNSTDTITTIATKVGYDDSAYFSRVFRKLTGSSPQTYRQKNS